MTPKLIIMSGPKSGLIISLDKPVVLIGRHPSNPVSLDDPEASRQHCLIKREGEGFVIKDLESKNGTYLNAKRVKESPLTEGSLIQVGRTLALFWLHGLEDLSRLSTGTRESKHGNSPPEHTSAKP